MTSDVTKASGYGILSQNQENASATSATGTAILSQSSNAHAGITSATGYEIIANPATNIKSVGYEYMWPGVYAATFKQNAYQLYGPLFPSTGNFKVNYKFMEERFPDCISFSSSGGPGFKTNVVEFDSGIVSANAEWETLRAKYTVNFEVASPDDIRAVEDFFYIAKGRAVAFRFKDWNDYQIVQQNIAIADGVKRDFPIFKRYQSGRQYYDRPISKPLTVNGDGTETRITVDDVIQLINGDVFVNEALGILTFDTPPPVGAIVKILYMEYDVPVRFDTDTLNVSFDDFQQLSLELPLVEVLI